MEEPPKIERIVSSKGISLSDTAILLQAYLSNIDQHHHEVPPLDKDSEDNNEQDATTTPNDADGQTKIQTPRKTREDWEAEALIAQMDALVNNKSSSGMMSDDVYERLKMITKSICAEVDGVPLSASGIIASKNEKELEAKEEQEQTENDNGASDFLAQLEEAERMEQQQKTVGESKRDKKKEKKAKKSAKKSAKKAKRKAKEVEDGDSADLKRAKVESW